MGAAAIEMSTCFFDSFPNRYHLNDQTRAMDTTTNLRTCLTSGESHAVGMASMATYRAYGLKYGMSSCKKVWSVGSPTLASLLPAEVSFLCAVWREMDTLPI